MTALLVYKGQLTQTTNLIWLMYVPSGLLLGGAFLFYKWRSYVEPLDDGVKVSTLRSSVLIDYDSIRNVKVQPLKLAFQDNRKRMVAPMMKPLLERPALFIRLRLQETPLFSRLSIGVNSNITPPPIAPHQNIFRNSAGRDSRLLAS